MKKNIKKTMTLSLATLITVGSTGVYAASFNDISNHWAKSYIEDVKDLGIIKGFEDGSFKPQSDVSRIQAIVMCSRILNLPQAEIDGLVNKYKGVLLKNGVPEWARDSFSIALSRGIIDENILTKLYSTNKAEALSSREEVTIFLARAIGLEEEAKNKGSNIILPFKDRNSITEEARPYVLVMKENNIINGDDQGNFNPESAITRAEMAKVLTVSQEYLDNNKKKDEELITVLGTIQNIFSASNKTYINIAESTGVVRNYEVNSQSILRIGEKIVTKDDLKTGLDVVLEVLHNTQNDVGVVKSLNSQVIKKDYEGTIYDLNSYLKTLVIEYRQSGIINRDNFSLGENIEITLDGRKVSFSDLRKDDDIKIEVTNDKITKIEAEANIRDIEGILKEIDIEDEYIIVEDEDGNKVKYELHEDVEVERDRREADLEDLRKGDEVEVHIEDKLVVEIDADVVETEITGTIRHKSIGYDKREIIILNSKTKKEETYLIPKDVSIELNNKRAKLDQLELGYYVKVTLEGEEIVEIEGEAIAINNKHLGRITKIERSYLELTLKDGSTIEVIFDDTEVKEDTGKEISTRYLDEGDEILVTGEVYQGEILATEIMRLTK